MNKKGKICLFSIISLILITMVIMMYNVGGEEHIEIPNIVSTYTETTETHCNGNTCTKTLYSGIMNYFDGERYVPIDTTVISSSYLNYDYEMVKGIYHAYFEDNINTGEAMRFEKEGYYFIYDLSGGKIQWAEQEGNPTKTKSIGALLSSIATISNNNVLYSNAFAYTNISYFMYNEMLKENFILSQLPPSGEGYLFLEYTGEIKYSSNLTIYANGENKTDKTFQTQGKIEFRDIDGNTVFYLPEPTIIDANYNVDIGFYDIKISSGKILFNLRTNTTFLENAVYPVVIDPTIQLQTANVENIADGYATEGAVEEENWEMQLRFNISSIPFDAIEVDALFSCKLTDDWESYGWDLDANVSRIENQTWDESITVGEWVGFTLLNSTTSFTWSGGGPGFEYINITDMIITDLSEGNDFSTFRISDPDFPVDSASSVVLTGTELWVGGPSIGGGMACVSKETGTASFRPYVNITYLIPQTPNFEPISNFSLDEDFVSFTIDLSPNVSDVEDPDSLLNYTWTNSDPSVVTIDVVNGTEYCYQETATISTSCGGLSSGAYFTEGLSPAENINDGDWETYSVSYSGIQYLLTNYTKPFSSLSSSYLQFKGFDLVRYNLSILLVCWDYDNDKVILKIWSDEAGGSNGVDCYNGSWTNMHSDDSGYGIYEEAIIWKTGGYINFTSLPNVTGTSDINITVWDTDGNQNSTQFTLTINAVNDAPWKEGILSNVTSTEDIGTITVITNADLKANFSDVEENNNPTTYEIIDQPNTTVKCYFDSNILKCDSVANQSTSNNIKFSLNDSGGLSIIYDFKVTLTVVNDQPWWDVIPDQTSNEDIGTDEVNISQYGNDVEDTDLTTWVYDFTNNNTGLVAITLVNSTGNLSWITVDNQFGNANITVTLYDTESSSVTIDFNLNIVEIDDAGSITNNNFKPDTIYNNQSARVNATITDTEGVDTVWIRANYTGNYVNYTNATFGFTNDGNVWSYFIDSGNFTNQDNVSWQYYANDSFGRETIGAMQSFIIKNRNATIVSGEVQIAPDPAIDTDTLNCTVGDRYDYDVEDVNFYYEWYNNSVIFQTNVDSQNITSGNLTTGDQWQCKVIPYDKWENGTKVSSQIIEIGSSNVGPSLSETNSTTINTITISDSNNPTNNNSAITFSVGFTDSVDALDDGFSAYFCKSDSFTFPDTCNGAGEWAKNQSNTTRTVYSADFTITSSETASSYNFYTFVTDNDTVSASLSGIFHVNHPPDLPNITISNETKFNTRDINLTFKTSDSDLDTITSYIYIEQNGVFDLNGTTTNQGFNFTGFSDATNYTWFVESIDEHDFSSGNSSMKFFQTDYTIPNNTITATGISSSSGQTATITMSQADNLQLDTCYFKFSEAQGVPNTYTETDCNTDIILDATNLTAIGTYTFFVRVNDTYGNVNEQDITFITSISTPTPPSGGGGGGAFITLFSIGNSCTQNSQCISEICDLELSKQGETSISYQTCVDSYCGNRLCGEDETFSSCIPDCGIAGIDISNLREEAPIIYYGLFVFIGLILFVSLGGEDIFKRFKIKLPKKLRRLIK